MATSSQTNASLSSSTTVSLEEFNTWTTENLKYFLHRRGFSTDGKKSELAALCYATSKLGIEETTNVSDSEYMLQCRKEYGNLLQIDGQTLPDPLQISSSWISEKDGISKWPPVFLSDIATFLMKDQKNAEKYLNAYKVGKAYEYFTSCWLKQVFYHPVSSQSTYCFLRAKCTPSQRLKDDDHTVWACIAKETGKIKSAYCSCTAGLGQTCNHIAGVLFRLESANKSGLTSCTSALCTWNIPSTTTEIKPKLIDEIVIKKSRHGKYKSKQKRPLERQLFNPLDDFTLDADKLLSDLREALPNSVLHKAVAIPEPEKENQSAPSCQTSRNFEHLYMENISSKDQDITALINKQPQLSSGDVHEINMATIGQSENQVWHNIRKGRLTASNFYQIFTKVNSYLANETTDMSAILSKVMGYKSPNPNIKSLKFGREMEPVAKEIYMNMYKKTHSESVFSECGVFLDEKYSYLAASPDMLVSCKCCGNGLLEVKSILVPECNTCNKFCYCKLPNFLYKDGEIKIKENHSHYCQIQGQLAISGRNWGDLCIYSCNGVHIMRIYFDQDYVNKLFTNLQLFFASFVAKEILDHNLMHELQSETIHEEPMDTDCQYATGTFFCSICHCEILESENIKSFKNRSICCDKCNKWFHFKCVGITKCKLDENKEWFCHLCEDN